MPSDDWHRELHERLLSGDPVASSELGEQLADSVFDRLNCELRQRFPELSSSEAIDDACADAVISYIKRPNQFDPTRGKSLFNYLLMSAEGDVRNALAKARRLQKKEKIATGVELPSIAGNQESEMGNSGSDGGAAVVQVIEQIFDDPTDRRLAAMIVHGERKTTAFAAVLRLEHLPADDQRKQVKPS